jgi:SAM-dependent methyltransferase
MAFSAYLRRLARRPRLPVPAYQPDLDPAVVFRAAVDDLRPSRVLEAGTLQAMPGRSTHQRSSFPWVAENDYVRMDVRAGADVDVVCDLHNLPQDWTGSFDVFLAVAVWEHLERPWIAAREVERILAPGGIFMVSTHQCFPIHGHPSDFFRFSREALRLLFEDAGLEVTACDYKERCAIVPSGAVVPADHLVDWNVAWPSYVLVEATGRKPLAG